MWKRILVTLIALVVLGVTGTGSGLAQDGSSETRITFLGFDKSAIEEGIWEGQVTGDVAGDLRTELLSVEMVGPIWFVEFDWIVNAEPAAFTARLTGTLNTTSGLVVMTGEVIEGDYAGARIYQQGQMIDANTSRFQGTLMIMEQG